MRFLARFILFSGGFFLILISLLLMQSPRPATYLMIYTTTGNVDIHAMLLETAETFPIVESPSPDYYYDFIDGWLYFTRDNDLYRKRLTGKKVHLLENLPGNSNFYSRSRDGKWLLISNDGRLYRMRPDGSELKRLSSFMTVFGWTGDWMILLGKNNDIQRVNFETGEADYLADFRELSILFSTGEWFVHSRGSDFFRLHIPTGENYSIGSKIVMRYHTPEFFYTDLNSILYSTDLNTGETYKHMDITDCAFLDFQAEMPETLFWCGYQYLYRVNLETHEIEEVMHLSENDTLYRVADWSDDAIILSAFLNDTRSLYRFDRRTAELKKFTQNGKSEELIAWTPDRDWALVGEFLAAGQNNGKFSLYRLKPDGSSQELLTHQPLYFNDWSPRVDENYSSVKMAGGGVFLCLLSILLQRRRNH